MLKLNFDKTYVKGEYNKVANYLTHYFKDGEKNRGDLISCSNRLVNQPRGARSTQGSGRRNVLNE